MPIIVSDSPPTRGPRDARRHREKQREVIKKNLPNILVDQDIITGDPKGRKVRVRVRKLEPASFRHGVRNKKAGESQGPIGVGQGDGHKGDVLRPKDGTDRGRGSHGPGGEGPGTDEMDTDVPLEEILEYMKEDIGLPNFKRKESRHEYISEEKIHGTKRSGPRALLKRRQSVFEAMRRQQAQVEVLIQETGRKEEDCLAALHDSYGDVSLALTLLNDPDYVPKLDDDTYLTFDQDDQRFHGFEERRIPVTQAVVFVVRDVSASMDAEKTYLARSTAFWVVRLLEQGYQRVIVRFIVHPGVKESAELVNEHEAFRRQSAGGTMSHTAFEKVEDMLEHEYSPDEYNIYILYFSDGDDFTPDKTVECVRTLVQKGVSMIGYAEVRPESQRLDTASRLLTALAKGLPLRKDQEKGVQAFAGGHRFPVVCCVLRSRSHIRAAVEVILKQSRWEGG